MKTILPILALLAGMTLHAQDPAALKKISAAYEQIEEYHQSWSHSSMTVGNDSGSFTNELWESHDDDKLMKLQTYNGEDHGETTLQFFFKSDQLIFTLERREEALIEPNATDVIEKRYYFIEGQLARVLEKKGRFPAGKPTKTAALKNQEIPLSEIENADETYRIQHEMTASVITKLQQLSEDGDPVGGDAPAPTANGTSGDGWRLIAGSQSRDGKYALGWGQKGKSAPEGDADEDGAISGTEEDESLMNYVIELKTGQIVGEIEGKHFGDKSTYNHATTETSWSPGSNFMAQVNSGKWASWNATLYEVLPGEPAKVSPSANLLEAAKKAVAEHMDGSDLFKKHGDDGFAYTVHDVALGNRAGQLVASVEIDGQIPKSEEDSYFACTTSFKVIADENGGAPTLTWIGTERHQD
jgi:hypothetical protein